MLALHLDLNNQHSGAGHELARTVAKADVSVFGPEFHADASGVEWVLLVSFEVAPVRFRQRSELDDLHALMQPNRGGLARASGQALLEAAQARLQPKRKRTRR